MAVLAFCILGIVYAASVGIYLFEGDTQPEAFGSITRSMWWSMVTVTTVGYGDIHPVTPEGKIFASVIMLIGIGIVAIPSGLLASALTRVRNGE